jgi:hypothetical protein
MKGKCSNLRQELLHLLRGQKVPRFEIFRSGTYRKASYGGG